MILDQRTIEEYFVFCIKVCHKNGQLLFYIYIYISGLKKQGVPGYNEIYNKFTFYLTKNVKQ